MAHAHPVGPFPPGVDAESYDRLRRRVLWTMPSGLYLLGSRAGARRNLMTLNWATQLALEPKLLGVSVETSALTHELVRNGACFSLSILARSDRAVVRRFVKPAADDAAARTLAGFAYLDAPVTGAPVLASALAWLECRLQREVDCGSHTLFVGEVVDAAFGAAGEVGGPGEEAAVLRMDDTRMSYGG
jgi:flavin reductase (DIM6/NTAB) family NADH-FMN oxidoreductase RutF